MSIRNRVYEKPLPENETVQGDGTKSGGRGTLPATGGVYVPNYQGVNQILFNPGGSGKISFMQSLANTSIEAMNHQMKIYDNLEFNNAISETNNIMISTSAEWKKDINNASGKGYQEFISSQYDSIANKYIKNASNGNVKQMLQGAFSIGKKDYVNKAFQEENEMMTSYSYENTTKLMQQDLINISINPEMTESYSKQYLNKVATLEGILPANKYNKFKDEAIQNFVYSNGLGWIEKNPYQAKDYLQGDYYKNSLPADKYLKLLHTSDLKIKESEMIKLKTQKMFERADNHFADANYSDYKVVIASGAGNETDIESLYDSGQLGKDPEKAKIRLNKLKLSLLKFNKSSNEKQKEIKTLEDYLINNTPIDLSEVKISTRKEYMHSQFKAKNDERYASGKSPLTFVEKVYWLKDRAGVYNYSDHEFQSSISSAIKYSKDSKEIIDATQAVLLGDPLPIMQGMGDDVVNFSRYCRSVLQSGDASKISDMRDRWFNQDEVVMKARSKEVSNIDFDESMKKQFYREYKLSNIDTAWYNFSEKDANPIVKDAIDANLMEIFKKSYIRTGDVATSKAIAASFINSKFIETNINGKTERMLNAPNKDTIGLDNFVISNIVSDYCQSVVTDLSNTHKIPISMASAKGFIKYNKSSDIYTKPLTTTNQKVIRVKIDNGFKNRNLNIESINGIDREYNLYYLKDESDPASKVYLINPKTLMRYKLDFNKAVSKKNYKEFEIIK